MASGLCPSAAAIACSPLLCHAGHAARSVLWLIQPLLGSLLCVWAVIYPTLLVIQPERRQRRASKAPPSQRSDQARAGNARAAAQPPKRTHGTSPDTLLEAASTLGPGPQQQDLPEEASRTLQRCGNVRTHRETSSPALGSFRPQPLLPLDDVRHAADPTRVFQAGPQTPLVTMVFENAVFSMAAPLVRIPYW